MCTILWMRTFGHEQNLRNPQPAVSKGTALTSEKTEQPDKGSAPTFAQPEDNRLAEVMGEPEVIRLAEVIS